MLQLRIGTIWTSSGCAVCDEPARELPQGACFTADAAEGQASNYSIRPSTARAGRIRRSRSPTFIEPVKIAADRDEPQQLMTGDRGQPGRGDAAAVLAVGRAAELARRDLGRQIGRDRRGRAREDALVGRATAARRRPRSAPSASAASDSAGAAPADRRSRCSRSAGSSRSSDVSPSCGV